MPNAYLPRVSIIDLLCHEVSLRAHPNKLPVRYGPGAPGRNSTFLCHVTRADCMAPHAFMDAPHPAQFEYSDWRADSPRHAAAAESADPSTGCEAASRVLSS